MTQMALNPRQRMDELGETGERVTISADAQLNPGQQIVDAAIPDTGSRTITLPPCGMSRGRIVAVRVLAGSGDSVIVQDDDDAEVGGNFKHEMFNAGDLAIVACLTGQKWELLQPEHGERFALVPLAAVDTAGGVLSWQNPESVNIVVEKLFLHVTTKTTGACTLDGGVTAVSATTLDDTLIDGLDANAATGLFSNLLNPGSNGLAHVLLASGKWVTVSVASGASAGLVGWGLIVYRRLAV